VGMSKQDIDKIKHIDFIRFSLHLPDNYGIMKVTLDDHYCEVFDYLLDHWQGGDAMCFGPLHAKLAKPVQKNRINVKVKEINNLSLGTRANNVKNTKYVQLEKYPGKKGRLYCKPILQKNEGPYGRFNHNVLLPNGDVVLCCSDYGLRHKLGNLLNDNYEDLFLSEEYKKIMRGLEDESIEILCRTCEHAVII
jgi:radical SAM protein with 4Fe4S-binding SPASM domain